MRSIRNLFAIQTRALLPWPIGRSIDLMLIITPLKPKTRTLSRPMPTRQLTWNGVKRNRRPRLQLLPVTRKCQRKRWDQNTPIYSRKKLPSWTIYKSVDFMVTMLLTLRTTGRTKRHLKKKLKKMAISQFYDLFAKQTPQLLSQALYTLYKTRYSDKQTTKFSFPISTLM